MRDDPFSRRDFLKSAAAAGAMVVAIEAAAQPAKPAAGAPLTLGVIGAGAWGKHILRQLSKLKAVQVKAVCDSSEVALKAGSALVPGATGLTDYRRLLDDKSVAAVVIASPTPQHKAMALDALAAGKHVYCEAPLAHTIEDARAIAVAAKAAKVVFQSGLQWRTNPLYVHAMKFVRSGALDRLVGGRAQWRRKESWYRGGVEAARERDVNWRLYKATSAGLPGEIGTHQMDYFTWAAKKRPTAIHGLGSILRWKDDSRELADTVTCMLEYPNGFTATWEGSLANSFGGSEELLYGSNGSILLKQTRAWLFKESDAPLLGWEVYARQDKVGDEQGIVLVANSTKLLEAGEEPSKHADAQAADPVYSALELFAGAAASGGESPCDAVRGFEATVTGIKANEAVVSGTTVKLDKALYDLG